MLGGFAGARLTALTPNFIGVNQRLCRKWDAVLVRFHLTHVLNYERLEWSDAQQVALLELANRSTMQRVLFDTTHLDRSSAAEAMLRSAAPSSSWRFDEMRAGNKAGAARDHWDFAVLRADFSPRFQGSHKGTLLVRSIWYGDAAWRSQAGSTTGVSATDSA